MVTICPSFINCLITSEALTAILWANSATVMVSGTCTSMTRASTGAACTGVSSRSRSRRPRGPPRQLLRPTPPLASPRVLISFFLACSSAQLEDNLALLTSLPSLAAVVLVGLVVVGLPAGLCSVPLMALLSTAAGFSGSGGFFATNTFLAGVFIMVRIASASAKAVRRRVSRSMALAASSSAWALESAWRLAMASAAARAAASESASAEVTKGVCCSASRSLSSWTWRRRRFSANSSS